MNNPLVAQEEQAPDGPGPLTEGTGEAGWGTGVGIVESVNDVSSLKDGSSWVESGLAYGGVALEAAGLVVDPISTLTSNGLSWLIEHVEPLQQALDWFAGDPDGVRAYGQTWGNVSQEVNEAATQYGVAVEVDVAQWVGAAGNAYRHHAAKRGEALSGAAELASTISSVVTIMGEVVSFVREFVRDLVADCVSRLITYALEAIGTLGFGIPFILAQAALFVSKTVTRITELIQKLTKTISNVSPKLKKMVEVFGEIMSSLGRTGKQAAEGAGRVVDRIDVSGKVADRVAESTWKKFDDVFGTDVSGKNPVGSGGSGHAGGPGSDSDPDAGPDLAAEAGSGPDGGSPAPHGGTRPHSSGADTQPREFEADPGSSVSGETGAAPPRSGSTADGGSAPPSAPRPGGEPPTGSTAPDGSPATPDPRTMTFSGDLSSGGGVPDAGGGRPSGPAPEAPGGTGAAPDAAGPRPGAGGPPDGGSPGADGGSPPSFPEGNPSTPSSTSPSDVTPSAASATPAAPSTPPRADQSSSSPSAPAAGPAGSPGTAGGQSGAGGASPSGGGNRPGSGGGWTGTPGTPGAAGRPQSTTDAPRASGNTGSPTRPGTTGRAPEGPPKPRAETAGTSSPPRGPERGPGRPDTSGRSPDGGSPSSRPGTGGGGAGRPPETSPPSAPKRTDVPGQQRDGGDGSNRPNTGSDGPESAPQQPKDDPGAGNGDGSGPPRDDADRPEPGTPEYERKIDDALEQLRGNRTDSGVSGHTDPNVRDLARRVPDDGQHFTLDAHMGPDGRVHIGDRGYSPEELSDVLRRLPEWDGNRPIRLVSCDSEDFAADLARRLDVSITAPRGLVWSDNSGRLFVSGTDSDGNPTWPPDGGWDTHHPDSTKSPASEDGFHPPRDGTDPGQRPEEAEARGKNTELTEPPLDENGNIDFGGKGSIRVKNDDGTYTLYLNGDKYPESTRHVLEAQEAGHPEVLTIDNSESKKENAETRRDEALARFNQLHGQEADKIKSEHQGPQLDRDEYPPARTYEGGSRGGGQYSSVRLITGPKDNQASGSAWWNHGIRGLPDGIRVRVVPVKPEGADESWGLPPYEKEESS